LLSFAGFPYRRFAPSRVDAAGLERAWVVVLIHATLPDAGSAALAQFAARGGKLVLIGQEGTPSLYRAAGVEAAPPAHPAHFDRLARTTDGDSLLGFPALVPDAVTPLLTLSPLPGTRVLATRAAASSAAPSTAPAVTLAPGGAAIDGMFGPGSRWEKSWLLQAVLAALDPALAEAASAGMRRQAEEAMNGAVAHWTRVKPQADVSSQEAQERLRALQALRADWGRLQARQGYGAAQSAALQAFIQKVRAFDLSLTPARAGEIRGVWIHTYAPTDWDEVARKVKAAGLNCLFVRVGRGGNVIYPSAFLPRDVWAEKAGGDEMQRAIEASHRHGLRFFAWRVNFHMGSAPAAYRERMSAGDRLVRDSHGVQAAWANPGDPRNTDLEFHVMREMVEKYDVDGIQFDYIRYPDAPSFDYDYGPVSRREFERALGRPVPHWPADVLSGPLKTEYEDWERGNINLLVKRVYREVKRLKPWVQVSAAVWRNHRRYRALLKQDWPLWAERGWLDLVVPMDYTPELDTFAATVDGQVALTRGKVPVAAGIGSWLLETPEELVRQVEIARESGAAGFVLFAYNAEQIDEQLAALRLGATSTDTWTPFPAPSLQVSLASGAIVLKDAPLAVAAGESLTVRVATPSGDLSPRGARASRPDWRIRKPLGARMIAGVRRNSACRDLYPDTRNSSSLRQAGGGQIQVRGPSRAVQSRPQEEANVPRSLRAPDHWQARLETPDGTLIQPLDPVAGHAGTVSTAVAPAGRFRPVVRGTISGPGGEQPFLVYGPLIEGLPPSEMAALRAQERPPVFSAPRGGTESAAQPRLGVYAGGLGAESVIEGLSKHGLRVAALHRLRPDHLAAIDTLVLPQLADVAELDLPAQTRLRQWVEAGHTLILTHDAIGARWHPRLFPELIQDAQLASASALVTAVPVGEIPVGTRFRPSDSDQFVITPGPTAQVLARENLGVGDGPSAALGAPIIVAGPVGHGTVILCGFLSGYPAMALADDEARVFAALTRYRAPGQAAH
jgi:uncharacterized lipoprotein YddW (UPF0748 family)